MPLRIRNLGPAVMTAGLAKPATDPDSWFPFDLKGLLKSMRTVMEPVCPASQDEAFCPYRGAWQQPLRSVQHPGQV